MRVKNVNGSSRHKSPNGAWMSYWEKEAKSSLEQGTLYKCPACKDSFLRKEFDGSHVQKVFGDDKNWYIIPLCSSCNQRTDTFDVDNTLLVPVPSNL